MVTTHDGSFNLLKALGHGVSARAQRAVLRNCSFVFDIYLMFQEYRRSKCFAYRFALALVEIEGFRVKGTTINYEMFQLTALGQGSKCWLQLKFWGAGKKGDK